MKSPPRTGPLQPGTCRRGKWTWDRGELRSDDDLIATETPVALVYNGVSHAVMMATPDDLEDFALGFSLSEGLLDHASQLLDVNVHAHPKGLELQLTITQQPFMALRDRRRQLAGRTGCGLCGVESLDQVMPEPMAVSCSEPVSHRAVQQSLQSLQQQQYLQAATGAVHAAAWCDTAGDIRLVREDVGRHNALDKVIGACFRASQQVNAGDISPGGYLIVTSRASYEMVVKAARAGFGMLAAVSAPTSLAISLAEACGMTLVGFTRAGRHVVYTHPDRLIED